MPTPPRRRSCRSATGMTCRRTAPTSRPVSCASPGCTRCPRANAAFHFTGDAATEGFTLCFEDRDGIRGLHHRYDRQAAQEATCQRITLSLRLAPHEFESLFTPGTGMPDLRSVFRLDTGGEEIRATLHAIESYDPQAASARCTFTRLSEG